MTSAKALLQRARGSGNPVIHEDRATFIWEGDSAPYLISDLHDWEEHPRPFQRISPRLWTCSITLPRDAYLEYAFFDPKTKRRFPDPLNRHSVNNGLGSRNHFFYMPESMPSPFSLRRADIPSGALTRHYVDTWMLYEDGKRVVYLYRPPVKDPVPLLVVYDGLDYLGRGKLATIVDNMIAEKRIRPIAMILLHNGGRRRSVEYACSDATIAWLDHEILPLARKRLRLLNIREHPGAFGVLGASFGGLMAMYTGLRAPEIFGKVLSQSGVFESEGRDFVAVDLVRDGQARELKIWMDIGRLDSLWEDNRRMHALLNEKGYQVTYREFTGGHCYTAWRNDLWRGLEAMFPP